MNMDHLTTVAQINPPVAEDLIGRVEAQLGMSLPGPYLELLRSANGMRFDNGLVVYAAEEVVERNETFEVKNYAPGYVAIGDDSGGRAVMMSLKSGRLMMAGIGDMDADMMEPCSKGLHSWVADGWPLPRD
ncbi:SMI1/KNR4 family protein [Massilia pseudoviolaceinigra]|uniref:SMI1/KNR4 family protein n=1 Tax=Massilia pseudoviolaceinigra TaxID=3057165 RepID=UPI0027964483|nr:SMI1/KNR4 family protein [Massilia sp. CCM 9206]MDQ1922140.1 SMI1/KNR4 family protein [Massilia sp. CCM 9206]